MKGFLELLERESGIAVRRGTLPEYVRIEDTRANGVEMAEVASVLYAGATLTDKESLYMPERPGMPVNGVLPLENDDSDEEKKSNKSETPSKPKSSFFEKMGKRIGSLFSGNEDDDTELI